MNISKTRNMLAHNTQHFTFTTLFLSGFNFFLVNYSLFFEGNRLKEKLSFDTVLRNKLLFCQCKASSELLMLFNT